MLSKAIPELLNEVLTNLERHGFCENEDVDVVHQKDLKRFAIGCLNTCLAMADRNEEHFFKVLSTFTKATIKAAADAWEEVMSKMAYSFTENIFKV